MPPTARTTRILRPSHLHNPHGTPSLQQLLTDLIDGLIASSDPDSPAAGPGPAWKRWKDKHYAYLEAVLPSGSDREIDLSAHGGRVLIRVVR